jgi:hypothetical protein
VNITGKVLDSQSNPVGGASVSIQVGDPPIHINLVYSDNSGAYADSFILPVNTAAGSYVVYASAGKAGYSSAQKETQFTVLAQTTATSTQPSSSSLSSSQTSRPPSQCFIATATYGSEISPEVSLLRYFRDAQVLKTSAGRSFMQAFNAFYYSFSPQVASFISSNGVVRSSMKVALYPLIGILFFSSKVFQTLSFSEELAVTISGITAALGMGFVYLAPVAILSRRLATPKTRFLQSTAARFTLSSCGISAPAILLGEEIGSPVLLTAATVALVLSFFTLAGLLLRFVPLASVSGKKAGKN